MTILLQSILITVLLVVAFGIALVIGATDSADHDDHDDWCHVEDDDDEDQGDRSDPYA